jgi:5-methylcytosine-specific restriction protein A
MEMKRGDPHDKRSWRRLSAHKLRVSPLCEACERAGRIVPAVHVHHKVAINDGGDLLVPLDALMSVCIACHNEQHSGRIKGCDINGMPLDPKHAWYGADK